MTRETFVARLANESPLTPDRARGVLAVLTGEGIPPQMAFAAVRALACAGIIGAPPRTYREG